MSCEMVVRPVEQLYHVIINSINNVSLHLTFLPCWNIDIWFNATTSRLLLIKAIC
jgi:hypothetical protein